MSEQYGILMHKDVRVVKVKFEDKEPISFEEVYEEDHLPYGVNDASLLRKWLEIRNAPIDRPGMHKVYEEYEIHSPSGFAALSHNASMSDCYWFADEDELEDGLTWDRVNPIHGLWTDSGKAIFSGKYEFFQDLDTPDFGTSGVLAKTWVRNDEGIFLLKEDKNSGWDSFGAIVSGEIARLLGIYHVPYYFSVTDGRICSVCPWEMEEDTELIPFEQMRLAGNDAYEILNVLKENSMEDSFGRICVLDYLTDNTTRDLTGLNFLANTDSLKIYSIAPVMSHGNAFSPKPKTSDNNILTGLNLYDGMVQYAYALAGEELSLSTLREIMDEAGKEIGLPEEEVRKVAMPAIERAKIYNAVSESYR